MNNEHTSSTSQTDWQQIDAMTDEAIDLSDCPEIALEMFAKAVVRRGLAVVKTKIALTKTRKNFRRANESSDT